MMTLVSGELQQNDRYLDSGGKIRYALSWGTIVDPLDQIPLSGLRLCLVQQGKISSVGRVKLAVRFALGLCIVTQRVIPKYHSLFVADKIG
jgi:hypothetical protein